jgi:hypothetical protein
MNSMNTIAGPSPPRRIEHDTSVFVGIIRRKFALGGRLDFVAPPVERVEKVEEALGQRLFHQGLVGGPEISAKMRL